MIAVTIPASTGDAALEEAGKLPPALGSEPLVPEFRLDLMADPAPPEFLAAWFRPCIVTCRRKRDLGAFTGPEPERLALLRRAAAAARPAGAGRWIDVEVDALEGFDVPAGISLIASHHEPEGIPADLDRIVRSGRASRAEIVKIAVMARTFRDLVRIADFQQGRADVALFSMGELGLVTRLLYRRLGSPILYARTGEGEGAPGQPHVRDLRTLYFGDAGVPARIRLFGLLGDPTSMSLGPLAFNAAFRDLGIPALYLTFPTAILDGLREFVERFPIEGLSVTAPHKEALLAHLDEVDEDVREAGAANTVVRRDGRLLGMNSDVEGVRRPVAARREVRPGAKPPPAGDRALVVGAGGAARAAVVGLRRAGLRVTVAARDAGKARALAEALGAAACRLEEIGPGVFGVLVNATPAGGWSDLDRLPLPEGLIGEGMVVLDMNVIPERTRLLALVLARGGAPIPGREMWLTQAAAQMRAFLPGVPEAEARLRERTPWAVETRTRRTSS